MDAEVLLQKLGLPYRVLLICSGDIGFPHAKQFDLEVWAAGQKRWLEVSSCSNFTDFQARRANIRFREEGENQNQFIHLMVRHWQSLGFWRQFLRISFSRMGR